MDQELSRYPAREQLPLTEQILVVCEDNDDLACSQPEDHLDNAGSDQ